jgi:hypothetical protein
MKKVKGNRPWRSIRLWDVEVSTFSRQSAHRWRWGCQHCPPAVLYLPGRFLVLISVRGWVDPRAIVRLEGLGQLEHVKGRDCMKILKTWVIMDNNIGFPRRKEQYSVRPKHGSFHSNKCIHVCTCGPLRAVSAIELRISLYSTNIFDKKGILRTVSNTGIYCSIDI